MALQDSDAFSLDENSATESLRASGGIKYRIEYMSSVSPGVAPGLDDNQQVSKTDDSTIMEYVEVRLTKEAFESGPAKHRDPRAYHAHTKGHSYITILSPAVHEALRCVVDYYPGVYDFSAFMLPPHWISPAYSSICCRNNA